VQDAFSTKISTFSEHQSGFLSYALDTRELSYECPTLVALSQLSASRTPGPGL
jgi:hypothetical protein